MAKKDKLKAKLLNRPKDFTWTELESLLGSLGFEQFKGKGSRRKFIHAESKVMINLHEPHPGKILKMYVVDQIICKLKELGE